VAAAIAHCVGQIGLPRALRGVELRERLGLRFEADEPAVPRGEQRPVGRRAIDRIGADVDDVGRPLGREQVPQRMRGSGNGANILSGGWREVQVRVGEATR